MTVRDDLDRHVAAWLTADAPTSPPEHLLGEVLAQTARTRRRPAWRIPERWIQMSAITSRFATSPRVPWRMIAVAVLTLALIAGAVFVAGSLRQRVPPPFGPAANGAIYYSMNGDLMVADSPTGVQRTILGGDTNDIAPLVSPDGTRMVFVRGEIANKDAQLWTAATDDSAPRKLADVPTIGWAEWSPQSDTIAVLLDRSPMKIQFIDAETGATHEIDSDLAWVDSVAWRPPAGEQLLLHGRDATTTKWGIYQLDRDGTGLQRLNLDPGYESDPYYEENNGYYLVGPAWSPDGTRLLYYTLEPDPTSPDGHGWRHHVATIDANGTVTSDRLVAFDASMDDEFNGTWIDNETILYQTVDGTEHRMLVGSVDAGSARDLGLTADEFISRFVSPDATTAIIGLPVADGTQDIRSIDLATGSATPIELGTADVSWQRLAKP